MTSFFKQKKRLWALLLTGVLAAALLCISAAAAVGAVLPDLPKDQCVVDDAGVLSEETLAFFDELNGRLETYCKGAQVFALTVQYTGNLSTEDYALEAFNTWGVGSSKENNGLLILLVMECREFEDGDYYMVYGDGFADTLVSSQLTPVYNSMEDAFAAGDYDTALRTAARNAARLIANVYGAQTEQVLPLGGTAQDAQPGGSSGAVAVPGPVGEEQDTLADILLYFIVFIIAAALLLGGLGAAVLAPFAAVFGMVGGIGRLFGGRRRRGPYDRGGYPPPPPPGGPRPGGYRPPRTGSSYHFGGNSSHYHGGSSWGGSSSGRSSGSSRSGGSSGGFRSSGGGSFRSGGSGGGRSHGGGGGRRR